MNKLLLPSLLVIAHSVAAQTSSAPPLFSGTEYSSMNTNRIIQGVDIVGEAFSLKTQRLLYREYHQINGDQHTVIYHDPAGKEFSRKTIDYSISQQAPSFKQHNQWSGETIAVDYKANTISLSYRKDSENKKNTEKLIANNTLIIDAGFNRYIQNNWLALNDGQSSVFDFALADRQDLIALEIERSACPATNNSGIERIDVAGSATTSSFNKSGTVCFSIGADNRLIRWLIGSLELVYQQDTRQLLRFTGLANINDRRGKGLKVDIHYYYPPSVQKSEY